MNRRNFLKSIGKICAVLPFVGSLPAVAKTGVSEGQPEWIKESFHRQSICRPQPGSELNWNRLGCKDCFRGCGQWDECMATLRKRVAKRKRAGKCNYYIRYKEHTFEIRPYRMTSSHWVKEIKLRRGECTCVQLMEPEEFEDITMREHCLNFLIARMDAKFCRIKSQKFNAGDRVHVTSDLPKYMSHFRGGGKNATVLYSYSDKFGGAEGKIPDYALDIDGFGFNAWYPENLLTSEDFTRSQWVGCSDGKWHLMVSDYYGGDRIKLYIDGEEVV